MSYRIVTNSLNKSCTLHFTGTTANVIIAGNSSVSNIALGALNFAANTANTEEVLTGASIHKVAWGIEATNANASITVARGSNVVLVLTGSNTLKNFPIGLDPTANLVVTFNNSSVGFLLIELQKQGTPVNTDPFERES